MAQKSKEGKKDLDHNVNQHFGIKGRGKGKMEWGSDQLTKDEKIKKKKNGLTG